MNTRCPAWRGFFLPRYGLMLRSLGSPGMACFSQRAILKKCIAAGVWMLRSGKSPGEDGSVLATPMIIAYCRGHDGIEYEVEYLRHSFTSDVH